MSVQSIENWAFVIGKVEAVVPEDSRAMVQIHITSTRSDGDFPNLFEWAVGQSISVGIPSLDQAPEVGSEIEWRMRIIGPGRAMVDSTSL